MQKKIIALAVAALASSAAFAQTNVTVYGVVDMTFDRVSRSGANDVYDLGGANEAASLNDNNYGFNRVSGNSSYIGFKGSEALGNGLTAVFQLEAGVAPDSGAALSLSRDSFAGIAGSFGTVVAGQLTGPTRALGAAVDVNAGATGIGANSGLLGKLGNHLTNLTADANSNLAQGAASGRSQVQASPFDTRWRNAIAYVSPKFFGLTGTVAYVANEGKNDGGANGTNVATANGVNTSGWDLGLKYENGPAMAAVTYNAVKVRNQAAFSDGTGTTARVTTYGGLALSALGTELKTSDLRIGGTYDFGVLKLSAVYDRVKLDGADFDGALKQNVYGVGVVVPVGNGRIIGQYYKAGQVKNIDIDNTGAKLYEIGYVHSLSKRTEVRAVYATIRNNENANYDFGVNAVGNGSSAAVGAGGAITTTGLGSNVSGLQLGVRHSF